MVARTITWEQLEARLRDIESVKVRVGVFSSGPGAELVEGGEITMLGLAAIHELGLGHVPRRSFIQGGIEYFAPQIAAVQAKLVRKIFAGEMSAAAAGDLLGTYCVGRIRAFVREHPLDSAWANAPSTIAQKGSDRPLVDTGRLMASVSYQVTL